MKYVIALAVIIALVSGPVALADGGEVIAVKTASQIRVDGEKKDMEAYLIDSSHYFKLRDIAYILNGTDKNFSVAWNESKRVVTMETGRPYTVVGGELSVDGAADQAAAVAASTSIYVNGKRTEFAAYLINSNHYFKLRDLGKALDFGVDWSQAENAVSISGRMGYYDVNPISPWDYQKLLGKGMDVDWSKTKEGRENYRLSAVQAFKARGIDHVRIRVKDNADEALFTSLDAQIDDCLKVGVIPIIAYQADEFKNEPTAENIQKVVNWWGTVAERYQDKSSLLAFDLLIEATDAVNKQPEKLNEIYERLVTEIRKTNPQRIVMISPRLRSDPQYLHELVVPSQANGYIMAQWHFYAAGPSKENEKKLWTTGSAAEKKLILDKIGYALDWQKKTNIPTWVGAWMPRNYNDGNEYSVEEQTVFAGFMTSALADAEIPFAINSDTKFYDRETNQWIEQMQPVIDAIFLHTAND